MKQRKTIRILALFAGAFMFITACNLPTETEGENYNLFQGLEAVEGAEEVIVTINQGSAVGRDAYFEFEIENVNSEWIKPGVYDGWCIEWTKHIAQQGALHEDIQIYSTYGQERWKPLNYFLNIKDELKTEDPELSFTEFQAVIWSIQEGPEFDVNSMSKDDLPPRLLKDGELNFSKEKVNAIIEDVRTNAPSFEYAQDKIVALFMKTGEDEQDIMVPVDPPGDEEETVSHGYVEGVTPSDDPRFAERTYPVIQADWEGPGGDKRWLGWNLGATEAPESFEDEDPDHAGWYFPFNSTDGGYHDGSDNPSRSGGFTGVVADDTNWEIENDPCNVLLGGSWRVPNSEEWEAALNAGAQSVLKLHAAGSLAPSTGLLRDRGSDAIYWTSTQHSSPRNGFYASVGSAGAGISIIAKGAGLPIRCIED